MQKKVSPSKAKPPVVVKRKQHKKADAPVNNRLLWILAGAITLITFIVFYPVFKNQFVNWDDGPYVLENFMLMQPLGVCVKYFFGQHYFVGNYQPITMTLYALIYHSSQLDPAAYHAVSLIIHLANTLLVFWFIFLLSGRKIEVATIVALFFGIHPMHVESVVWVAELKDVLYTFFFIGGLIAYYKFINSDSKKLLFLILSFLLFVFSGLSKPAAVTFPLTILLLDFYHGRRFNMKIWLEKIPFFIFAVIIGLITLKAQQQDRAIADLNHFTIVQRFMLSAFAMLDYIVKLVLPYRLSALNPFPSVTTKGFLPYIYYAAPLIALGVLFLVYRSLKYSRLVAFGFLFYLANIILVLQFLSIGLAITSDRYSYVPYIGLLFIVAMSFSKLNLMNDAKGKLYKNTAIACLVIFTIAFSYISNARTKVWNNSELLWTDVIEKYPNDFFGYGNRGVYYHSKKINDKALADFNMSIKLNPKYSLGYNNRANIYSESGKDSLAIIDYTLAILYDSTAAKNYTNRATIYGKLQKYDLALKDFDKAIQIDPNYHMIYYNRSIYYSMTNQHEKELADLNTYLKLKPDDHEIYNSRGVAYQFLGKYKESVLDFTTAIQLNPANGVYYQNRSYSENQLGQKESAKSDAMQAQRLGVQFPAEYLKLMGL